MGIAGAIVGTGTHVVVLGSAALYQRIHRPPRRRFMDEH